MFPNLREHICSSQKVACKFLQNWTKKYSIMHAHVFEFHIRCNTALYYWFVIWAWICKLLIKKPRNRFHGIDSASLCSLAELYDNPIPSRFLTPIDCSNISALINFNENVYFFYVLYSILLHLPPLRFHCVGGCWDRTQECCYFGHWQSDALTQSLFSALTTRLDLVHYSARSHCECCAKGNLSDWWGEEAGQRFQDHAQCLVHQFASFSLYNQTVNGRHRAPQAKFTYYELITDQWKSLKTGFCMRQY